MPTVPIRSVGLIGVIKDIPGYELPPEAWTSAGNMEFTDTKAVRMLGETIVEGTPSVAPVFLFPAPTVQTSYWVYTDTKQVFLTAGGYHSEITRAEGIYTGGLDDPWTGTWLGGVLVLNNGVNDPQQWLPIGPGTDLTVLANWPANTKARVLRGFGNFLLALDITRDSVRYPTTVKWSHPADPGGVPVTWDPADATKLAGELPLNDTPGFLIDALPIGRSLMIYKEDAVIRFDRVQTNAIFQPTWISNQTGMLGVNCVTNFQPGQQLFLSHDSDVMVTDGQQVRSILDKKIRTYLDKIISPTYHYRSFVVTNYHRRCVMVCYPTGDSPYCNEAAIWNWEDNTWSFREISPTLSIQSGMYDENAVADSWEALDFVWEDWVSTWGQRLYTASRFRLIGGFLDDGTLREVSRGNDLGGVPFSSFVERTGLAVVGQDRMGNPKVDPKVNKLITELYPIVNAPSGADLQVSIGASDGPNTPITWEGPYTFDPETDEKIDCYTEGRYLAVRFQGDESKEWELTGYVMNIENLGEQF